jgi:hypothetical protein
MKIDSQKTYACAEMMQESPQQTKTDKFAERIL